MGIEKGVRKFKHILPIVLFGLLMSASISAQDDFNKAGRTSFQFLKIGIGARVTGLGEAAIANMSDVNSVFWNPAAITGIPGIQASFSYTRWFGDLRFTAGALGFHVAQIGVFAINYMALDYGDLQEALITSPGGSADTRTGNLFGGGDLAIGLAFSRMFTDKLSIGVNVKYLREELFSYTASTWAFDVGSYYHTGWKGVRLAMSAQNFSGSVRWLYTGEENLQSFELPLIFRIGWSIDLMGGDNLFLGGNPDHHRLALNMDAIHTNDYAERLHIGMEYCLLNLFTLRGGYRINYDEGNLSLGCGIRYVMDSIQFTLDYAYVSYDYLNSPHRLTMTVGF